MFRIKYVFSDVPYDRNILGVLFVLIDINIRLYMRRIDGFTGRVNAMIPQDIILGDLAGSHDTKIHMLATPEILSAPFRSQPLFDAGTHSNSRDILNVEMSKHWSSSASTRAVGDRSYAKTLRSSDLGAYWPRLRHRNYKSSEKRCSYVYKPRIDETFLENLTDIDDIKSRILNLQFSEYFSMNPSEGLINPKIVCYLHDKSARIDLVGILCFSQSYLCFGALSTPSTDRSPGSQNRHGKQTEEYGQNYLYSIYTDFMNLNNERTFTLVVPYTEILEIEKTNRNISQMFDWVEIVSSSGLISIKLKSKRGIMLSFMSNKDKHEFCEVVNERISKAQSEKPSSISSVRSKSNTAYITPTLSEKLRNSFRTFRASPTSRQPVSSNNSLNTGSTATSYNILNHPAYDILSIPSLIIDDNKKTACDNPLLAQDYQRSGLSRAMWYESSGSIDILKVPLLHIFPDAEDTHESNRIAGTDVCDVESIGKPSSSSVLGSCLPEDANAFESKPKSPTRSCTYNLEINKPWENYFYTYVDSSCVMVHYELLRHLIYKNCGVPHYLRHKFYSLCMGIDFERNMHGVYAQINATKSSKGNDYADIIEKDVRRSMPNHVAFKSKVGTDALSRLLNAYSWRNRDVGYAQSLNIIGAVLLMYFDEDYAFVILSFIVEHLLVDQYTKTLSGTVIDQYVFTDLVEIFLPGLRAHTISLNIDIPVVTISWFICIFQNSVSHKAGISFLDSFLLDGPIFLFWASLAILDINQDNLVQEHVKDIDFLMILKDFFGDMERGMDEADLDAGNHSEKNQNDIESRTTNLFQKMLNVAYTKYSPVVTRDFIHVRKMKHQRIISESIWRSTISFNSRILSEGMKFSHDEICLFLEVVMHVKFAMSNKHGLRNSRYNLFTMEDFNTIGSIIRFGFWNSEVSNSGALKDADTGCLGDTNYSKFGRHGEDGLQCDQLISLNDYRRLSQIFGPWKITSPAQNVECDDSTERDPSSSFEFRLNQSLCGNFSDADRVLSNDYTAVDRSWRRSIMFITFSDRIYYYCLIRTIVSSLPQNNPVSKLGDALLKKFKFKKKDNGAIHTGRFTKICYSTCFVNASAVLNALEIIFKAPAISRLQFIFKLYDIDGDGYLSFIELLEFCLGLMEIAGFPDIEGLEITKKYYSFPDKAQLSGYKLLIKDIRSLLAAAIKIHISHDGRSEGLINHQILLRSPVQFLGVRTRMLCQLLYSGDQEDAFIVSPGRNIPLVNPQENEFTPAGNFNMFTARDEPGSAHEVEDILMSSLVNLYSSRLSMKFSFEDMKLIFMVHRNLMDYFDGVWMITESRNPRLPGMHVSLARHT